MNLKRKTALVLLVLFVLPLTACDPFNGEDNNDVYIQTREVQTALNEAGFRVSDIDASQPFACSSSENEEGRAEEYNFAIFAPFSEQAIVQTVTEQIMKDLGIKPITEPEGGTVALRGVKGNEEYYLSFLSSDSALFVAITPCKH
jgi:hypothetical protein